MDRYLFNHFIVCYVICFVSMVGLYIVIDLFSNADEFLEETTEAVVFLSRVGTYYFIHSFEYFARLSPIITQIAAMTTLASLHRQNEVVALLAGGVPTRRILLPIFAGVMVVVVLGILNRELVLPAYSEKLQRMHDNIDARNAIISTAHFDDDKCLIRAGGAFRDQQRLEGPSIVMSEEAYGQLVQIRAANGYWEQDQATGHWGWRLEQPSPIVLRPSNKIWRLPNGDLFFRTNVDFEEMIQQRNWMAFAGTYDLIKELHSEKATNPQLVRNSIHNRLMQPALNILLVLIGIPFVLTWERKNIYRSIAVSMVLSGIFQVVDATSGYFALYGYLDPVSAAWLPLFLFAPIAFAQFHRIGT